MDNIKIIQLQLYDVIIITYGKTMEREMISENVKKMQKLFPDCILIPNREDIITDIQVLRNPEVFAE